MTFAVDTADNDQDLMLTSLVDVFAVIVVYLTFGFAVSESTWSRPLSDIALPPSLSSAPSYHAMKLSVSRTSIRLENQLVMLLQAGQLPAGQLDEVQNVKLLLQALQREKQAHLFDAENQADMQAEQQDTDVLYVEANRGLPYQLIERILRTASAAGFTHFRLAVHHRNG